MMKYYVEKGVNVMELNSITKRKRRLTVLDSAKLGNL